MTESKIQTINEVPPSPVAGPVLALQAHGGYPPKVGAERAQERRDVATSLMLDQNNFKLILEQAQIFARSGLVAPVTQGVGVSKEYVAAIMIAGLERGITPMRAIMGMSIIKGSLTMRGELALALVRENAPQATCDLVDWTDERASWEMGLPGGPKKVFEFTIQDAERARIFKFDSDGKRSPDCMYLRYPRYMLMWRAFGAGARVMFPHILAGAYLQEELAQSDADESRRSSKLKKDDNAKPAKSPTENRSTQGASKAQAPEHVRKIHERVKELANLRGEFAPAKDEDQSAWRAIQTSIYNEICEGAIGKAIDARSLDEMNAEAVLYALSFEIAQRKKRDQEESS